MEQQARTGVRPLNRPSGTFSAREKALTTTALSPGIGTDLTESGEIGSFRREDWRPGQTGTSTSLSLRERVELRHQQYLSTVGVRGCHRSTTSPILTSSRSERTSLVRTV